MAYINLLKMFKYYYSRYSLSQENWELQNYLSPEDNSQESFIRMEYEQELERIQNKSDTNSLFQKDQTITENTTQTIQTKQGSAKMKKKSSNVNWQQKKVNQKTCKLKTPTIRKITKPVEKKQYPKSKKHNFSSLLTRKLKELMKKVLNIKKKFKLQNQKCLKRTYIYFFHQKLKDNNFLLILKLFLGCLNKQNIDKNNIQIQQGNLKERFKQLVLQQQGSIESIDSAKIKQLQNQLRNLVLSKGQDLIQLAQNGKMGQKGQFVKFAKVFLQNLGKGEIKLNHK